MVSLIKDKSAGSIVGLLVVFVMVHFNLILTPLPLRVVNDSGGISYLLSKYADPSNTSLTNTAYYLLLIVQALGLNIYLTNLKMFTKEQGLATAMVYVLLSGIIPGWNSLSPGLIANSFVIVIFVSLSKLYGSKRPSILLLNTGTLIGVSMICYHPSFILVFVALFALLIIRPFKASEVVLLIFGVATPLYLFGSALYINNNLDILINILPHFQFSLPISKSDWWLWIKFSFVVILLIQGMNYWNNENSRMVIQLRKNWAALMVMLFFMLPVPFLFRGVGLEAAVLSLVPLAAVISNGFIYPKKPGFTILVFWLGVILAIHSNLINFLTYHLS